MIEAEICLEATWHFLCDLILREAPTSSAKATGFGSLTNGRRILQRPLADLLCRSIRLTLIISTSLEARCRCCDVAWVA